jgi:osmotically-inducible protein OsmY
MGGAETMRKQIGAWTAFFALTLAAGCGRQDAEGLAKVCHKVRDKGVEMTGGRHSKLATGCHALHGSTGSSALDSRVAVRLRWDKALTDSDIQVSITAPGVVKLEGTITNQTQRGRALDLAKSTQGVEDAVDALEIKAPPPKPDGK